MMLCLIGLASAGCGRETESVQTLLEKAAVLNDRERYDEALTILATAIEADRGNSDVYYLRGVAYENLQQFDSA